MISSDNYVFINRCLLEMSQRNQDLWLRTFKKHSRGNDPLDDIGKQDLTVEIAIDQLPEGAATSHAGLGRAPGLPQRYS